jgi:hypothetical protein
MEPAPPKITKNWGNSSNFVISVTIWNLQNQHEIELFHSASNAFGFFCVAVDDWNSGRK